MSIAEAIDQRFQFVRRLRMDGVGIAEIARKVGVSRKAIKNIVSIIEREAA